MEIDREALRHFVAVAEQLQFTRVAAALGISRQALSRSVRTLEEQVGLDLFVRPSERTELTEAGRALLDRAADLLATDPTLEPGPAGGSRAPRRFRVGIMPGVTLSKWGRIWDERRPDLALDVVRTDEETQVSLLREGILDVSFVRLPVDADGLSVIPLYSEVPVVVVPADHLLTVLDEVSVMDLVDEHLLQDPGTVPPWRDAAAAHRTEPVRALPVMRSTADAVALVAAGSGVVIVPQSVARLHHRKDVTYRPVTDVEETHVALAWVTDRTSSDIEAFVGIVRGRSERSSRASGATEATAVTDTPVTPSPVRAPARRDSSPGTPRVRKGAPPKAKRRGRR